ncbi:MAG: hypothetical protein ACI85K_000942 [Hyphomicrobiaceae bacterium]|jgi:hypothetical protein
MAAIRKSGGVVPYFWQGKLVDPRDDEFAEHLSLQRFRTIENAASEEVSIGWITPADPTGDNFSPEDLDGGIGTWLRFRIDKKSMPMKWLQIHRDAAEKARGKKMSAKERRELKDDLMDQLLPRVLPTITLVDALLFDDRKTVLLFATSKSAKEAFTKLFFESFSIQLEPADPLQSGMRSDISDELKHTLERVNPIRWPNSALDNDQDKQRAPISDMPRPAIKVVQKPKAKAPVSEAPSSDPSQDEPPPFEIDEPADAVSPVDDTATEERIVAETFAEDIPAEVTSTDDAPEAPAEATMEEQQ